MKTNEENAYKALIEILKKKFRKDFTFISKPDEVNRKTKDVDFIIESGNKKYAVEHTRIERYIGQKEYLSKSFDVVQEINNYCKGKLPENNHFLLLLPYSLIVNRKKFDISNLINEMTKWIIKETPSMKDEDTLSCFYNGEKVSLICDNIDNSMNGNVFRAPVAPNNCDELTLKSFNKVINEKIGKISKYKFKNYRTVLLLEDISGSFIHGFSQKNIGFINKIKIRLFLDYIIILVSVDDQMIVGNIWKEKRKWYKTIPFKNRFSLHT